jgi:PAS domain-containing protein
VKRQLNEREAEMKEIIVELRRFWEAVIQKDVTNFCEEAAKLLKRMDVFDDEMRFLTDDFPNCPDVWGLYQKFLAEVRLNEQAAAEARTRCEQLRRKISVQEDIAAINAKIFYPNITPFVVNSRPMILRRGTVDTLSTDDFVLPADDREDKLLLNAVRDLTERSRLGGIWIPALFVLFGALAVIGFFSWMVKDTEQDFTGKLRNSLSFLVSLRLMGSRLSRLQVLLTGYPVYIEDWKNKTPENRMEFAQQLYKRNLTSVFDVGESMIRTEVESIEKLISEVYDMLPVMVETGHYVADIKNRMTGKLPVFGKSLREILDELLEHSRALSNSTLSPSQYYDDALYQELMNVMMPVVHTAVTDICDIGEEYAVASYDDRFETLNEVGVAFIVIVLLLVCLPFIFGLFSLQMQEDAIANSFANFPNSAIRAMITKYGLQAAEGKDGAHLAQVIVSKSGVLGVNWWLLIAFVFSFAPMVVCGLIIVYSTKDFVGEVQTISNVVLICQKPFSELFLAFDHCLCIFICDNFSIGCNNRSDHVTEGNRLAAEAEANLNEAMWGKYTVDFVGHSVDNLGNMVPADFGWDSPVSVFEILSTVNLSWALDLVVYHTRSLVNTNFSLSYTEEFMSLWYWHGQYAWPNLISKYSSLVTDSAYEAVDLRIWTGGLVLIIGIVFQILICGVLLLFLWSRRRQIRRCIWLYYYIPPDVLLQNANAVSLLEQRQSMIESPKASFEEADTIIERLSQGVVATDRKMVIKGYNRAFTGVVRTEQQLYDRSLIDMLERLPGDHSWPDFIQRVNEALQGKYDPQFSMQLSARLMDGTVVSLYSNVICLVGHRAAREEDDSELIDGVVVFFDDCTREFEEQQEVIEEQRELTEMLESVIPSSVLKDILGGFSSICFVSHDVSVGHIRVNSVKSDLVEEVDVFTVYHTVFSELERLLKKYDYLTMVRTTFDTFTFCGGLFSQVTSPARYADQAVRYALDVMGVILVLEKRLGNQRLEVSVGINFGGPVTAGIISLSRPEFQVMGPVLEIAYQILDNAMP